MIAARDCDPEFWMFKGRRIRLEAARARDGVAAKSVASGFRARGFALGERETRAGQTLWRRASSRATAATPEMARSRGQARSGATSLLVLALAVLACRQVASSCSRAFSAASQLRRRVRSSRPARTASSAGRTGRTQLAACRCAGRDSARWEGIPPCRPPRQSWVPHFGGPLAQGPPRLQSDSPLIVNAMQAQLPACACAAWC